MSTPLAMALAFLLRFTFLLAAQYNYIICICYICLFIHYYLLLLFIRAAHSFFSLRLEHWRSIFTSVRKNRIRFCISCFSPSFSFVWCRRTFFSPTHTHTYLFWALGDLFHLLLHSYASWTGRTVQNCTICFDNN